MKRGVVSFVGAGPGDPELITLKGLRRIREAKVVLHDRSVPAAHASVPLSVRRVLARSGI